MSNMKRDVKRYYHQVEVLEEIVAQQDTIQEALRSELSNCIAHVEQVEFGNKVLRFRIAATRRSRWLYGGIGILLGIGISSLSR